LDYAEISKKRKIFSEGWLYTVLNVIIVYYYSVSNTLIIYGNMRRVITTPLDVARAMKPGDLQKVEYDDSFNMRSFTVRLATYNADARKENIFIHHSYNQRASKMVLVAITADQRDEELENPVVKDDWRKKIPKEWKEEIGLR